MADGVRQLPFARADLSRASPRRPYRTAPLRRGVPTGALPADTQTGAPRRAGDRPRELAHVAGRTGRARSAGHAAPPAAHPIGAAGRSVGRRSRRLAGRGAGLTGVSPHLAGVARRAAAAGRAAAARSGVANLVRPTRGPVHHVPGLRADGSSRRARRRAGAAGVRGRAGHAGRARRHSSRSDRPCWSRTTSRSSRFPSPRRRRSPSRTTSLRSGRRSAGVQATPGRAGAASTAVAHLVRPARRPVGRVSGLHADRRARHAGGRAGAAGRARRAGHPRRARPAYAARCTPCSSRRPFRRPACCRCRSTRCWASRPSAPHGKDSPACRRAPPCRRAGSAAAHHVRPAGGAVRRRSPTRCRRRRRCRRTWCPSGTACRLTLQVAPTVQLTQLPVEPQTLFVPQPVPAATRVPVSLQTGVPVEHGQRPLMAGVRGHAARAVRAGAALPGRDRPSLRRRTFRSAGRRIRCRRGRRWRTRSSPFDTTFPAGEQTAPAAQLAQAPLLQTLFSPQAVPFAWGCCVSVQDATPSEQVVCPT